MINMEETLKTVQDHQTRISPETQPDNEKADRPEQSQQTPCADQLLHLQADFINFKKRIAMQHTVREEQILRDVIMQLLPVLDDLEHGLEHADQNESESWNEGVRLVHTKFLEIMKKMGLESIDANGTAFDPVHHEAVQVLTTETDAGKVLQTWQKGYLFRGKLLRPAKVIVSQPL